MGWQLTLPRGKERLGLDALSAALEANPRYSNCKRVWILIRFGFQHLDARSHEQGASDHVCVVLQSLMRRNNEPQQLQAARS